jgi:hypothetical protein
VGKRKDKQIIPSSFRDPSGFLFTRDGTLYRQINTTYRANYEHLMNCGLFEALTNAGLMISHEEVDIVLPRPASVYKIIKPELIPFISYPYEWCFSQLKDAAFTTLRIQKVSLDFGMSLKDCSAYNIQFRKGKPVLIDTLSFEKYRANQPWVAYRQFCQHFLAPLALMSHKDIRLNQLFRVYIDGVPLDLASKLLPTRTCLSFSLLSHIHLHARSQTYFADKTINIGRHTLSRLGLLGIIDSLEDAIRNLKIKIRGSAWADYYKDTNYSPDALEHKKQLVSEFLNRANPETAWDLGANIGIFSRIASSKGILTNSLDNDPLAVEKNYLECVARRESNILPLVIDVGNPSPGIGWDNRERMSLAERGPVDAVLALAIVHHLTISNNVPFGKIASYLGTICNWLIIEFVPQSDSQVQRLLSTREDLFPDYTQQVFEREFGKLFIIESCIRIKDSERTLYLMRGKQR